MDYTSLIKEVNIPKLVEALRWCDAGWEHDCEYCPLHLDHNLKCMEKLLSDAAAAIEALQAEVKDAFNRGYNAGYTAGIGYMSFKREKEPKRGHWIENTHTNGTTLGGYTVWHDYTCSVCGALMGRKGDAYCYKCGAKMEVQDAEM